MSAKITAEITGQEGRQRTDVPDRAGLPIKIVADGPCAVLLRLMWTWIPEVADLGTAACMGGAFDMTCAQSCLERCQLAAHVMLTQYLDRETARLAGLAYGAGLAAGFYGADSAISKGWNEQLETALSSLPARGNPGEAEKLHSPKLMRSIWAVGSSHATMVMECLHGESEERREGTHCQADS